MSKKILFMSSAKLTALSIGLLLAVFCTIGMSFTPGEEGDNVGNPNDSTYVSGPRRSHYYEKGIFSWFDTNHYEKDYAKATASTAGNGYVTLSSPSGGGLVTNPASYANGTTLKSGSNSGASVSISWNCNHEETSKGKVTATAEMHTRKFTIEAFPNENYYFKGWSTSTSEGDIFGNENPYTFDQIINDWNEKRGSHEAENKALPEIYYAIFKQIANLTFAVPKNGSYTFSTEDVSATTVSSSTGKKHLTTKKAVTLTATPASGYKFFGWYKNSDAPANYLGYTSSLTLRFEEDATIYAKFIETDAALFQVKGDPSITYYDLNVACEAAKTSSKVVVPIADGTVYKGNYTIPSGVTLLVPYDDQYTLKTTEPGHTRDATTRTRYLELTLAKGAVIDVYGSISVGCNAIYAGAGGNMSGYIIGAYGQVNMQYGSEINMLSGSNLYCWGYIIGSGNVYARTGSKLYEAFQFDFRGGTHVQDAKQAGCLPMNQYYVQNIEAPLTIYSGVSETLYTAAYASKIAAGGNVSFVGDNGLFKLAQGAYLTRHYNSATDRIIYNVYGDAQIQNVNVSILVLGVPLINMNSSDYVLPITNNMDINIHSGTTSILYATELLAGARVVIDKNATVKLRNNLFVYDKEDYVGKNIAMNVDLNPITYSPTKTKTRTTADLTDAQIIVNGRLETYTESSYKGYLYTTRKGADICSNENGVIVLTNGEGTKTTTIQNNGLGAGEQATQNIPITSAQLHNDETLFPIPYNYTATKGTAAGTTIEYHNGHWGWATIWVDTDGSTILHCELGQNQPQDNYKYPPKSGYEFEGWITTTDNANQETVYTATVQTGEYLDIVDAADNSLTINMTPFPLSGWPYQVNDVVYRRTTSGEGNQCKADRTITITHDKDADAELPITVLDKNGVLVSRHKYTIPHVYSTDARLSGTGANSIVFVRGGTLTVDGERTAKAIYVAAGAELKVEGSLDVEKLVLRTSPWSAAILTKTGTLSAKEVYYSRQVADNSGYFQFGLPLSTTCNVEDVTLSDGSKPTYGSAWILKSYNEASRANSGVAEDPKTQNNWVMLPGDNPVTGGVGYEIFSGSKYYREYYFPVDMTALTNSVAVTRTEGAAGAANAGWNVVCSPLMNVYTVSPAPEGMVFSWLREEGDYEQLPVTEVKPAIPFSYQAKASGNITFGNDIKVPSAIAARRMAAAEEPTRIQWIHLDIEDEAGIGDQTSIYSHPTRYEQTYQTGIDVAKQSLTASRAIIYSSHAYGDMAFAGVADTLLESGIALTVYSPAAQELTFSLRDNDWLNRMESVWLIDKETGAKIDLLSSDYSYEAAEGTTRGRFFIQGQFKAPQVATELEPTSDSSLKGREIRKVIINQKMYIIVGEQIYDGTGKLVNK